MNKFIRNILKLSLGIVLISSLFSCGGQDKPNEQTIDYVNDGSVKLSLDYKDHDFFTDGIGQVNLKSTIDGDTAHFTMVGNTTPIKSRFYGIDTPESTGSVEPYGKAASNFTKEKLVNASENGTIVVSSPSTTYKKPELDSTGSRYLSLIWINESVKDASYESLVLLNLWIVQDGYSYVKAVDKVPQFEETFLKAEEQAKRLKLQLFSGAEDPLYNYGDYNDVSLLDLKKEVSASLKDSSHKNAFNGEKVRVRGTVAGFANKILYLQASFENDDGTFEYAGINVFVGMGSPLAKFTTVNTYIQLCGTCEDSENFGFQITGVVSWKYKPSNENDTVVLYSANDIPEEYKVHDFSFDSAEIVKDDFDYLFSPVNIENVLTVSGGYDSDGDVCLYMKDAAGNRTYFSVYIAFTYKPDSTRPNLIWSKIDDFKGKQFMVKGVYSFHESTNGVGYQINPRDGSDLVCLDFVKGE